MRTYLEMSADDYSRSRGPTEALRTALAKATLFQPPPKGALNIADGVIERRMQRLAVSPAPTRDVLALLGGVSATSLMLCALLVIR
jgi:hypothetical protein